MESKKREETLSKIRKKLVKGQTHEIAMKKIIGEILELAKPFEDIRIDFRDWTINEIDKGGP